MIVEAKGRATRQGHGRPAVRAIIRREGIVTTDQLLAFGLLLVTLGVGVSTLIGIRNQLWMQMFAEYTRRYSEIMDEVPFEARRPGGAYSLEALPTDQHHEVLRALRNYLNLCSEELYLAKTRRLDRRTWRIWTSGIKDTLRLPCFNAGWREMRGEYEYFPEFVTFIDHVAPMGPDPAAT